MHTEEQIEQAIHQAIREVFAAKGESPPALRPETPIDRTLGLDSLDWAAVVVSVEESTGLDPFASGLRRDLRTLGDLKALYTEVES